MNGYVTKGELANLDIACWGRVNVKINTKKMSYEEVLKLPRLKHKNPMKPQLWLATIVRIVCAEALWRTKFSYTTERMELVGISHV